MTDLIHFYFEALICYWGVSVTIPERMVCIEKLCVHSMLIDKIKVEMTPESFSKELLMIPQRRD